MEEPDIYRAYNFILQVADRRLACFSKVDGMHVRIEAIDYREGGAGPAVRKLTGRVAYGDITLCWGLSQSTDMWAWLTTAMRGEAERRNVSVILVAPDGVTETTRWNLDNAWPCEWRGAVLDALGNEVAIETLTLVHEGIERA